MRQEFIVYLYGMQTSVQKDIYDNYPVAQTNSHKGVPRQFLGEPGEYPEKLKSYDEKNFKDFLLVAYHYKVLFNFIKWMWMKATNKEYKDQNGNVTSGCNTLSFHIIMQQRIFNISAFIKGARLNRPKDPSNKQIGITNIVDPSLDLIDNWAHPGRDQCFVPYYGTWGMNIQNARQTDNKLNYFGSLQCGISGSVNFFLFMYLSSIVMLPRKEREEYMADINKLVLLSIMILAGDGGHNIREIIHGITLSVMLLHIVVESMKNNYDKGRTINKDDNNLNLKLYKHIITKYPEYKDISKESFNALFYDASNKWLPFTQLYYESTLYINVLGITEEMLREKNQLETDIKDSICYIKNFFTEIDNKEDNDDTYLKLHYFFGKMDDRYKQDFNQGYLVFFKNIIKDMGLQQIENNVVIRFKKLMLDNKCNVPYLKKGDIIYAFKSVKKSKKSVKKSKSLKKSKKSVKKSKKSVKKSKSLKKSAKKSKSLKKSAKKSKSLKKSKKSVKKSVKKSSKKSAKKSSKKSKKSSKKSAKKSAKKSSKKSKNIS